MNRSKTLYTIIAVLTLGAYAWVGLHLTTESGMGPVCLFKNVTGIPCPSCGITRAMILFLNGEWQAGVMTNPFVVLAVVAMLVVPAWLVFDVLSGKPSFLQAFRWLEERVKTNKLIWIPLVVLALANWGWNIVKNL